MDQLQEEDRLNFFGSFFFVCFLEQCLQQGYFVSGVVPGCSLTFRRLRVFISFWHVLKAAELLWSLLVACSSLFWDNT